MKINQADFLLSAPNLAGCPQYGNQPEITFVGRSNVGKSSLINSLLMRKSLAKTSNTPGKTRLINLYQINYSELKQKLIMADLPGYGYAKVSKQEQEKWGSILEGYLLNRESIRLVIQLIDIRHEPQPSDWQMLSWLAHHQRPVLIVLTKSDQISKNALQKQISAFQNDIQTELNQDYTIIPYSAKTHTGRDQLWQVITSMAVNQ